MHTYKNVVIIREGNGCTDPDLRLRSDRTLVIVTALAAGLVSVSAVVIVAYVAAHIYSASTTGGSLQYYNIIALGIVSLCALALIAKTLVEIFVIVRVIDESFSMPGLRASLGGIITQDGTTQKNADCELESKLPDSVSDFQHCATGTPVANSVDESGIQNAGSTATRTQSHGVSTLYTQEAPLSAQTTIMNQVDVAHCTNTAAAMPTYPESSGYTRG